MTNKTYINPDAIKEVPASAIKEIPASAIKEIPASAITDFTVDNLNIEFKTINGESIIGEGDIVIENELPVASNTTLGGVVVGSGLTVGNSGVISLNDNFINLPSTVSGLTDTVSGLTEEVSGLTTDVSGLTDTVSGLTEDVSGLTDTITKLSGIVEENEIVAAKAVANIVDKVNGLTNTVNELSETVITWNSTSNMNNVTTTGVYKITGERVKNESDEIPSDNLPIYNPGIIEAKLQVFAADNCVSQILTLLNVGGGDTNVYTRTRQNGEWKQWGKLQSNIEVGAIGFNQTKTFNDFTDNGMYSGVNLYWVDKDNVYNAETFVLIVVNGYLYGGGITQLKYSIKQDGSVNIQTRKKLSSEWSEWENVGVKSDPLIKDIGVFELKDLYKQITNSNLTYYKGVLNNKNVIIERLYSETPIFTIKHANNNSMETITMTSPLNITFDTISSMEYWGEDSALNALKTYIQNSYNTHKEMIVTNIRNMNGTYLFANGRLEFNFYTNNNDKKVIIRGYLGSSEIKEVNNTFKYNLSSDNNMSWT